MRPLVGMQLRGEDAPAGIVHDLTFPDVLSRCRKSPGQHSILDMQRHGGSGRGNNGS